MEHLGRNSTQAKKDPSLPPEAVGKAVREIASFATARFPLEQEGDRLRPAWVLVAEN